MAGTQHCGSYIRELILIAVFSFRLGFTSKYSAVRYWYAQSWLYCLCVTGTLVLCQLNIRLKWFWKLLEIFKVIWNFSLLFQVSCLEIIIELLELEIFQTEVFFIFFYSQRRLRSIILMRTDSTKQPKFSEAFVVIIDKPSFRGGCCLEILYGTVLTLLYSCFGNWSSHYSPGKKSQQFLMYSYTKQRSSAVASASVVKRTTKV